MKDSIFKTLKNLIKRYNELEFLLKDGYTNLNKHNFSKLSQEKSKLFNINKLFTSWNKINIDINNTKLLLHDLTLGSLAKDELNFLISKKKNIESELKSFLLPENSYNQNCCFLEIRAATGGNEAAIFSKDLCKMYIRYAEFNLWSVKIINVHTSEQGGGYKEIILKIKGNDVCRKLAFESGGHRVQRVPRTESQGRIHTSTCTVAIMPDLPKSKKMVFNVADLKIDTFRSSGAGGQHVNTTDSAVRITHLPSGQVSECQDERSQHKNKEKALSVLYAKIHTANIIKKIKENSLIRRTLLGTGERSDRNRTYNYPQNRVTDHRINLTLYRLDEVCSGKLDLLINPLLREYKMKSLSMLD
ncbi:peptide chain release factor 1 [Buchnera aphidicola (Cinara tujafilina)]|uniref:Peptide chain release factor 1 n=1 Tax=Buchnera aphidicola (Cinara tujafilina) TaxID=261317 RepID=F7WZ53_9GAMM|nr:peptide chain release factor 1 [Buchnera aphidicola]AEH39706.1 peptide chain release factor 1 [Buchnera aphidicola (Cinara tujafilina)]